MGKWFQGMDEAGVLAANFMVSAAILLPFTITMSGYEGNFQIQGPSLTAVLMLLIGTMASAAAGRVFYQVALTTTDNDNGFVTMFFLAIPVLTSFISLGLSRWISDLHIVVGPAFLVGLVLVTVPLLIFSIKTWRDPNRFATASLPSLPRTRPFMESGRGAAAGAASRQ